VVEPIIAAVPNPTLSPSFALMTADESELRGDLDTFVREHLPDCGVPVLTALCRGLPIDGITRYAREKAIDLIVIGTHAQGMVRRLLHGSISKSVMERAGCPVVMVPQRGLTRADKCACNGAIA
jgi:nucleotide-binding universal stress UspA family protein